MARIIPERMTAQIDGEFVVFLIGMRIWHETYSVAPGKYEVIYSGMPPIGLGAASTLVPASGRKDTARDRMQA